MTPSPARFEHRAAEKAKLTVRSLNNAAGQSRPATQRPQSLVTAAFFGKAPGDIGLGNNPWRPRRRVLALGHELDDRGRRLSRWWCWR